MGEYAANIVLELDANGSVIGAYIKNYDFLDENVANKVRKKAIAEGITRNDLVRNVFSGYVNEELDDYDDDEDGTLVINYDLPLRTLIENCKAEEEKHGEHICDFCDAPLANDDYICTHCKLFRYCSDICKKRDWDDGHDEECGIIQRGEKIALPDYEDVCIDDLVPDDTTEVLHIGQRQGRPGAKVRPRRASPPRRRASPPGRKFGRGRIAIRPFPKRGGRGPPFRRQRRIRRRRRRFRPLRRFRRRLRRLRRRSTLRPFLWWQRSRPTFGIHPRAGIQWWLYPPVYTPPFGLVGDALYWWLITNFPLWFEFGWSYDPNSNVWISPTGQVFYG